MSDKDFLKKLLNSESMKFLGRILDIEKLQDKAITILKFKGRLDKDRDYELILKFKEGEKND